MSDTTSQEPDQSPMASPINDIRKLKQNGQATAAEISDFLARMRGKSAVEVLGAVASSSLGKSFVQATLGVAVLVLVLTVIPWAIGLAGGGEEKAAPENEAAVVENGAPETPAAISETDPNAETSGTPPAEPIDIDGTAAKKAAADRLGVTEEKVAPANVNPLDGSNDDLLKGLE